MKEEKYSRLPPFKQRLVALLRSGEIKPNKPYEIIYQESLTTDKYKITIEIVEEDFFIDTQGRKWIKADE